MKLTFVRLLVRDFPRMLAFYRDAVGLPVGYDDGENYADLGGGATQVALFRAEGLDDAIASRRKATGGDAVMLVFAVESVDDAHRRLAAGGVRFETPPKDMPGWGIRVAMFRDPEGNLVELNQPLAR